MVIADLNPGDVVRITQYGLHSVDWYALVRGPCQRRDDKPSVELAVPRVQLTTENAKVFDDGFFWLDTIDEWTLVAEEDVPDAFWAALAEEALHG